MNVYNVLKDVVAIANGTKRIFALRIEEEFTGSLLYVVVDLRFADTDFGIRIRKDYQWPSEPLGDELAKKRDELFDDVCRSMILLVLNNGISTTINDLKKNLHDISPDTQPIN